MVQRTRNVDLLGVLQVTLLLAAGSPGPALAAAESRPAADLVVTNGHGTDTLSITGFGRVVR